MIPLPYLINWFRGLFQRPAELLEFFSGIFSLLWLLAAWFNGPSTLPSVSWLAPLFQDNDHLMVGTAIVASVLQLAALMRRHHWTRFVSAAMVGAWFAMLMFSSYLQSGLHPTQILYCLLLSMNGYIVVHVLDGKIVIHLPERGLI